ncbi:DNA polymerase I [Phytophthora citrophthora]|uniref:DNA polymerase I n=1 Tax=Phytophthora citrophthora TaxID=4793 RepID=A0AAD9LPY0_9STRA|nr:DNA polymerase I [Phytophthora citrophthora]
MKGVQLRNRIANCRRSLSTLPVAEEAPVYRKKSILVDGNNALHHFYDPLCTVEQDGVRTGAVDGLLRLLRRMDKTHAPEHISVIFDSRQRPTTRRLMQPSYKSDRAPTPRSLLPQFAYAKEVLTAAGVNCIKRAGMEADDIIASYSKQYTDAGMDVLVISNDNDFLQLVHDGDSGEAQDDLSPAAVEIYQPSKRRYIRERNLRGRFGLQPKLLPDFHALCGHKWKRLPRVGDLTGEMAAELVTHYGGLFPLLRQLDTLDDAELSKTLKQSITSVESSYRMVKLVDTVALPVAIEELCHPQLD